MYANVKILVMLKTNKRRRAKEVTRSEGLTMYVDFWIAIIIPIYLLLVVIMVIIFYLKRKYGGKQTASSPLFIFLKGILYHSG